MAHLFVVPNRANTQPVVTSLAVGWRRDEQLAAGLISAHAPLTNEQFCAGAEQSRADIRRGLVSLHGLR